MIDCVGCEAETGAVRMSQRCTSESQLTAGEVRNGSGKCVYEDFSVIVQGLAGLSVCIEFGWLRHTWTHKHTYAHVNKGV